MRMCCLERGLEMGRVLWREQRRDRRQVYMVIRKMIMGGGERGRVSAVGHRVLIV